MSKNWPVTLQIYLGRGKEGEMIRKNIKDKAKRYRSVSEMVVELMTKADPELFKIAEVKK